MWLVSFWRLYFQVKITHTFVNGKLVYNAFKVKIYEQEKIVVWSLNNRDEKYYSF
jgi:hypothetical protein